MHAIVACPPKKELGSDNRFRIASDGGESAPNEERATISRMTLDQAIQLAIKHQRAGRLTEAERVCQQILAVQPRCADALNLLGVMACLGGRNDVAVDLIGRAIAINPAVAVYHTNLGSVLRGMGRAREAIAEFREALRRGPERSEFYSNLGCALRGEGQLDEAIAALEAALRLNPNQAEVYSNLGNALLELGRLEEAMRAYKSGAAINPRHAEVQFNLAMCLLLQGDMASGWPLYEWRLKSPDRNRQEQQIDRPRWTGEPLAGKRILLRAEQGLGDTIHFLRYAGLVAGRGAAVIVQCQPELIGLLRQLPAVTQWVSTEEVLPPFDLHCPLLSLPLAFGTTLSSIPLQDPALHAADDRVAFWRARLADDSSELKAGLVWAGNPSHKNDRNRSIPLSLLVPLANVPRVRLFSLQKGSAAEQIRSCALNQNIADYSDELVDFSDTAALIENLDLIITVDTAVAHLAGAMGKPVWLLLPFAPDWRWLLERSDSPWYPSMRLFRQSRPGDWSGVVERVLAELTSLSRTDVRGRSPGR